MGMDDGSGNGGLAPDLRIETFAKFVRTCRERRLDMDICPITLAIVAADKRAREIARSYDRVFPMLQYVAMACFGLGLQPEELVAALLAENNKISANFQDDPALRANLTEWCNGVRSAAAYMIVTEADRV